MSSLKRQIYMLQQNSFKIFLLTHPLVSNMDILFQTNWDSLH